MGESLLNLRLRLIPVFSFWEVKFSHVYGKKAMIINEISNNTNSGVTGFIIINDFI
jgi:hypothetical protein